MEKQELILDEARQELEKCADKLERWQELSKEERFIFSYRLNVISRPFVKRTNSLIEGDEMTQEEMRWQRVIYQLVRFRRTFENLWKAKKEDEIDLAGNKTLRELKKLLEVYDNYMAGE